MAGVRIKVPGDPGGTKTAHLHRAVADEWRRAMDAKAVAERPKPKPVKRRTFAHIRDYREAIE
jgi:hypothetical protein